ncbi:MAG: ABC transporter ATP-binding protein [Gemmatimonadota bacterium]|jgi:oligopeptide/dipeptide ABC transporter ATP-binding protein
MTALLEVRGLTVSFPVAGGERTVVRDVSLRVSRGEAVALVGESGSGKTLTALSLMGLLPEGARVAPGVSVRIHGLEVGPDLRRGMKRLRGGAVGLVPQDPLSALNPVRRIGSQIREVCRAHGTVGESKPRVRVRELLAEVGLRDPDAVAHAFPHQLSGGMRQRALIALALAGEPDLLVADEPTSALDATVQLQILDLLSALGRTRRLGLLLITHDFAVVSRASQRVMVFYAGETVEEGTTEAVLAGPRHPYTRTLLAALPFGGAPKERFPVPDGPLPAPAAHEGGCAFRARCPLVEPRCRLHPHLEKVDQGRHVRCWVRGP